MSQTVRRRSICTNEAILKRAAERAGAEVLGLKKYEFYDRTVHGLGLQFGKYEQPYVFNLETGEVSYDGDYGRKKLNDLQQLYTAELTKSQYEGRVDCRIAETLLDTGEIEIQIQVGGGYAVADSSRG